MVVDPNFTWETRSKEPVALPSVLTPADEAKADLSLRATKSKTGTVTMDERERFLGKCDGRFHPTCVGTIKQAWVRELLVPLAGHR